MSTSYLGVQEELHFGSVQGKFRVTPIRSYRERDGDRKMGSPRPNYGRVKGMYDHQGLAGGRRWGASLGGQINHTSYNK